MRYNPFYGGKSGHLPDAMLGSNYDVVKTVYNNLPLIKEFQENPNVEFLQDNIEDIKKLLNISQDITNVSDNSEEILKALDYANSAQEYAEKSKNWAISNNLVDGEDYSSKYYANKSKEYSNETKTLKDDVYLLKPSIEKIRDNIADINIISNNINSIKVVGSDLSGSPENIPTPDYGIVGDSTEEITTESILVSLFLNYRVFERLNNSLEELLFLHNNIKNLPSYTEIYKLVEQASFYLQDMKLVSNTINDNVTKAESFLVDLKNQKDLSITLIQEEANKQITLLKQYKDNLDLLVNECLKYTVECEAYRDECILALNKIKEISVNIIDQIKEDLEKYIEEYLNKFKGDLENVSSEKLKEIEESIENLKNQSLEEITNNLNALEQRIKVSIQLAGQTTVNEVIAEGDNQKQEVIDTGEIVKQEVQDKINELGRPDWNNNVPDTPGYILNKPEIYTKDEIDNKLSSALEYKGSVNTKEELPTSDVELGDVYNVKSDDMNYAWDGTKWDPLGPVFDLDTFVRFILLPNGSRKVILKNTDFFNILNSLGEEFRLFKMLNDSLKFNSPKIPLDLYSKDAIIKINDKYIIATLTDLENLENKVKDTLQIIVSENKPVKDSILSNKLYGFNSTVTTEINSNSEINSFIVAENLNTIDPENMSNGTAIIIKQQNLL